MLRALAIAAALCSSAAVARAETDGPPPTRADIAAGFAAGDGATSFSLHGHLGRSLWIVGAKDPAGHWQTALRLTLGASVSADFSSHAFVNVAPFVEVGLGGVAEGSERRAGREVTVFARAEPLLVPGALDERGVRLGVGLTLHGFKHLWLPKPETSDGETAQAVLIPFALPVLGAINLRHLEVTTDVGTDGRMQYGLVVGLGR